MADNDTTEENEAIDEQADDTPAVAGETLSPADQLAQAEAQAAEYLDGWQRAQAELANAKKRLDRERSELYDQTRIAVIVRFLEVMDDFERALNNAPDPIREDGWHAGLLLVKKKFDTVLEAERIVEIEAEGQMFDPELHEAVTQEPNEDLEEGAIIGVIQKGYLLGDRVVRPALVRVAG